MTEGRSENGTGAHDGAAGPGRAPAAAGTGPVRRTVRVANPLGLHWRIAARFSQSASRYQSAVTVWNGDTRADGKSPTELIMLLAFQGTDLLLEVDGPDAAAAVGPLSEILAAPGGEDYTY